MQLSEKYGEVITAKTWRDGWTNYGIKPSRVLVVNPWSCMEP